MKRIRNYIALLLILLSLNQVLAFQDILFLENSGEYESTVKFYAHLPNGRILLKENEMLITTCVPDQTQELHGPKKLSSVLNCHNGRIVFSESILIKSIEKRFPVEVNKNYLVGGIGNHSRKKYAYRELVIHQIRSGISMKVYSQGNQLKYDFYLLPESSLQDFTLKYDGFDQIKSRDGGLDLMTSVGKWREEMPMAYLVEGEAKNQVPCEYLVEDNTIRFNLIEDRNNKLLVIDPILIFSTYSGSTADNWGSTAAFDQSGNGYAGGISTESLGGNFTTTLGAFQVLNRGEWDSALTKYDSLGTKPVYSTLLGGSGDEYTQSLIVSPDNELYVLGITESSNFPVSDNAFDKTFNGGSSVELLGNLFSAGTDIYISKISADGSELLASTFIGGTGNDGILNRTSNLVNNYGDESRGDIFLDEFGYVYVATKTSSLDIPIVNGFQTLYGGGAADAYILKLTPDLTQIVWSTYLGGSRTDVANSIKLNSNGQVVVAGGTESSNISENALNTYSGNVDGWVAIISPDGGELVSMRYVGTSSYNQVFFTDLDPSDNIYIYGQTNGDFPILGNVFNEGYGQFVQKYTPDLQNLLISTQFGSLRSGPDISPTAFLVNDCNNIYLSGWGGVVNSSYNGGWTHDMPVTIDAFQPITNGSDFYLAVFIDDMEELLYGTFLGGGNSAIHVDGGTSRFDKQGIVYHSVCAGCALSASPNSDFPSSSDAWSRTNNSANCNNAIFKFDLSTLRAGITAYNEDKTIKNITSVCWPEKIVFENSSNGGVYHLWDLGDGIKYNLLSHDEIMHQYEEPGRYKVTLKIIDQSTCVEEDSTFIFIDVFETDFNTVDDNAICEDDSFLLSASGGGSYTWTNSAHTIIGTTGNISITPNLTDWYFVDIINENGCTYRDSVYLEVSPKPDYTFSAIRSCNMEKEYNFEVNMLSDFEYWITAGDGEILEPPNLSHVYAIEGIYQATLHMESGDCYYENTITVDARDLTVPNVITPGLIDNKNDLFQLVGIIDADLSIYNRWGRLMYKKENYNNNWSAENLDAGTYYYYISFPSGESCKGYVQIIK